MVLFLFTKMLSSISIESILADTDTETRGRKNYFKKSNKLKQESETESEIEKSVQMNYKLKKKEIRLNLQSSLCFAFGAFHINKLNKPVSGFLIKKIIHFNSE